MVASLRRFAPAIALPLFFTLPAAAIDEYVLDDGTSETTVGVGAPPFGLACLNHFIADADALGIGSISIAWGDVADESFATLLVYRDPNGDGNPIDGDLEVGKLVTTSGPEDDEFTTYEIDPVLFSPGESFFIGFWLQQPAGGFGPASFDTSDPQGESWMVISFDNFWIGELGLNILPPTPVEDVNGLGQGNWMVRANAVPGPGSVAVFVGLCLVRFRRRSDP